MPNTFRPRGTSPSVRSIGGPYAPPPTPPSGWRKSSPLGRGLNWLVNAFLLQSQTVPTDLSADRIMPTVDIAGFAGWGMATYSGLSGSQTTGNSKLGALHEDSFLVVPDPLNTQILIGLTIFQIVTNLGALACEIGIIGGTPQAAASGTFPLTTPTGQLFGPVSGFSLPQAPAVGFAQMYLDAMLGGARFIVAPPGFGIYLSCFNQSAGQFTDAFGIVATIPGNFGAGR